MLQNILKQVLSAEIPQTLTEMYIYFCHESGSRAHAHSPHCLLHLSTAAHPPWTAFPIHHFTSHTAVTNHSLALTVYTPYLD